jgi:hypothetical protein
MFSIHKDQAVKVKSDEIQQLENSTVWKKHQKSYKERLKKKQIIEVIHFYEAYKQFANQSDKIYLKKFKRFYDDFIFQSKEDVFNFLSTVNTKQHEKINLPDSEIIKLSSVYKKAIQGGQHKEVHLNQDDKKAVRDFVNTALEQLFLNYSLEQAEKDLGLVASRKQL